MYMYSISVILLTIAELEQAPIIFHVDYITNNNKGKYSKGFFHCTSNRSVTGGSSLYTFDPGSL